MIPAVAPARPSDPGPRPSPKARARHERTIDRRSGDSRVHRPGPAALAPSPELPAGPVLGEGPDEPAIRAGVAAQRLAMLDRALSVSAFTVVNAAVTVFVLRNEASPAWLSAWLLGLVAVTVLRLALAAYRRKATEVHVARRLREHVAGALLTGTLWGAACLGFGGSLSSGSMMFLALMVTLNAASAIAVSGVHLPTFFGYAAGGLVPLVATYLGRPDAEAPMMASLIALFAAILFITVRHYSLSVLATLRLQARNEVMSRQLAAARGAIAAATRSKWETLAHLSHELRTPMNAVLGFSEAMRNQLFGPLGSPRYVVYAGYVHDSGRHVLDLIEAILETSNAQAGQLALDEGELDPGDILGECLRRVAPDAKARRLVLEEHVAPSFPRLRGDRVKLRQALLNLMGNAIRYTPAGGRVGVSAWRTPDAVVIEIADTGIGIAPDDLPRALEPFVRLNSPLTQAVEGVGLGLPLAKHIIELHGGTLCITSTPGAGTTVTVRLPCRQRLAA